ncbi:MAG: radical SAM protein [Deltaproteobacteria bacterium]
MESRPLTPEKYYRLPWNLADNAITWLEPTTQCNMACEGCYREKGRHRPFADVVAELESVKKLRKTGGISIAGGEPLLYPQILDLVRYVSSQGWKPIIITNGTMLSPEFIKDLKAAGLLGFTVHVDSHQNRPGGWTGKNEVELNELRSQLAQMIHEAGEGQISCAFNATIYRDTLPDIPVLTDWARKNNDIVQTMVYILFRSAKARGDFDSYVNGAPVDATELVYQLDNQEGHKEVMAQEVVDQMRRVLPDYEPCAFLNGTEDSRAFKWLLGLAMGRKGHIHGYLDSKFAEFIQAGHHFLYGTYLAYTRPCVVRGMQKILPLALFDRSLRRVMWQWLKNPFEILQSLYIQSFMIIQPVDIFADGRISMCDGCPDCHLARGADP